LNLTVLEFDFDKWARTLYLLLLPKRFNVAFVQKLQRHVTHTKKMTCSVDKERNKGHWSVPSVRGYNKWLNVVSGP